MHKLTVEIFIHQWYQFSSWLEAQNESRSLIQEQWHKLDQIMKSARSSGEITPPAPSGAVLQDGSKEEH